MSCRAMSTTAQRGSNAPSTSPARTPPPSAPRSSQPVAPRGAGLWTPSDGMIPGQRPGMEQFLVWEGKGWKNLGEDIEMTLEGNKWVKNPRHRVGGAAVGADVPRISDAPPRPGAAEQPPDALARAVVNALGATGLLHERPEDLYVALAKHAREEPRRYTHRHGRPIWTTTEVDRRDVYARASNRVLRPTSASQKMPRAALGAEAANWDPSAAEPVPGAVWDVMYRVG